MSTHKVGEHFKKCVWTKNSFDLLLISFVFYIHNSLEKQIKNNGVLLKTEREI